MANKCDSCLKKYKCRSLSNGKPSSWNCKNYQKIVARKTNPFNSKKFARNPRERGYMLLKRATDGNVQALADGSTVSVNWTPTYGILWAHPIDAEHYAVECRKWKSTDPTDEVFVVRVGSKKCPIIVDYKIRAPRYSKGNVLFRKRDMATEFYKSVLHATAEGEKVT